MKLQALRCAAMVSPMSFDDVATAYSPHREFQCGAPRITELGRTGVPHEDSRAMQPDRAARPIGRNEHDIADIPTER
jgi:hypothetical protein